MAAFVETKLMKPFSVSIVMLLVATLVLAGVLVAECTQDSGSSTSAAATNSQQAAPAGTASNPSSDNSGSYGGSGSYTGNGNYGNHTFSGQGFLTNTTLLNAAAAQLGVSEQALQNALTPQSGQRMNLTSAAAQLGVTPDQLRSALGFPAGGFRHGNQTAAMMTPASGQ
jgi:Tfp pilus assembly protein PilV